MPLGKRTDLGDAKFSGVQVSFTRDIVKKAESELLCGFDFIVAPLTRPDYRPPAKCDGSETQAPASFSRNDVLYINSSQWANHIVGAVSTWVDPDSPSPKLRRSSTLQIQQELGWAAHLGLQAVLMPPPPHPGASFSYSQLIAQHLHNLTNMAVWVTIPLGSKATEANLDPPPCRDSDSLTFPSLSTVPLLVPAAIIRGSGSGSSEEDSGSNDLAAADPAWSAWNQIRFQTDHHALLGVALELGSILPPATQLAKWRAEPVKAVLIPTCVFATNKRGFPVLPKAHQEFLVEMFRLGVQVIVVPRGGEDGVEDLGMGVKESSSSSSFSSF
eukprot:CAMPEP_0175078326 /NCGR_PEP_ID=MMETSP0052_2-20121109/24036_1 /TAXON_ID=51329 ORGANISM="Polytomella parva, Strain SAG 63-3" /NCGR_SAMPLE_ID=MMETSP0052_2 /ASSEMBLY_ACC=CAM_ASM_000194 /LENGTH=328 /DNA_ID=CAMNT_0016348195 /DNA_START=194 /DNA_END=1177 /DNA_ORIENTATION=+